MTSDTPNDDSGATSETSASPATEVFFRKAFLAQNMCVHPDEKVQFDGVGERGASVDFKNVAWDDRQRWWRVPSVCCMATVQCRTPKRCVALYQSVWHSKVPEGIPSADLILHPEPWMRITDPVFRDGRVPAFLSTAMAPIEAELDSAVARVVGLARWRCNRTGPVDLPTLGVLEWSMDGVAWKLDVRRPTMLSASAGPDLVVTEARRADIERLLAADEQEPLHQSLLREAESLLESNPRSALTIGTAATEVAVKVLVSTLAPRTSWLIQNVPSPPVTKILEEYIPTLLPAGSPPFAAELIKGLKAAVALRNEVVHGARPTIKPDRVSSAFRVFRDVVWLCDHFSGVPWAVNRVSRDTLTAMKLTPSVDTSGWFVD